MKERLRALLWFVDFLRAPFHQEGAPFFSRQADTTCTPGTQYLCLVSQVADHPDRYFAALQNLKKM